MEHHLLSYHLEALTSNVLAKAASLLTDKKQFIISGLLKGFNTVLGNFEFARKSSLILSLRVVKGAAQFERFQVSYP